MATTCPVSLDVKRLRDEVSLIYARVATDPGGDFHFHRGPRYAVEWLGYDAAELAALPTEATASFAGVANPHTIAPITGENRSLPRAGDTTVSAADVLVSARPRGARGHGHGHGHGPERRRATCSTNRSDRPAQGRPAARGKRRNEQRAQTTIPRTELALNRRPPRFAAGTPLRAENHAAGAAAPCGFNGR
jgi:hypothetical protein